MKKYLLQRELAVGDLINPYQQYNQLNLTAGEIKAHPTLLIDAALLPLPELASVQNKHAAALPLATAETSAFEPPQANHHLLGTSLSRDQPSLSPSVNLTQTDPHNHNLLSGGYRSLERYVANLHAALAGSQLQHNPNDTAAQQPQTGMPINLMAFSPLALDRLGPHILRSHASTAQHKQIPNNEPMNMERWRMLEPHEWSCDDVVAWMICTARKHQIGIEDMSIHKFVGCTGPLLMLMSQQQWLERDRTFGQLLQMEFRKLIGDDNSFLDDWMLACREQESCSAAYNDAPQPQSIVALPTRASGPELSYNPPSQQSTFTEQQIQQIHQKRNQMGMINKTDITTDAQQICGGFMGPTCSTMIPNSGPIDPRLESISQHQTQFMNSQRLANNNNNNINNNVSNKSQANSNEALSIQIAATPPSLAGPNKNRKRPPAATNSNGTNLTANGVTKQPRKRSQHTKGNKLWEFIRDALRDPETSPSVVRWEDRESGVFRIVESEKLARLWGDKKNNQKMTYEKLSRAMRTYYDKQILAPVPKTGIYPKKLVYKFGALAFGWRADGGPPQPRLNLTTETTNKPATLAPTLVAVNGAAGVNMTDLSLQQINGLVSQVVNIQQMDYDYTNIMVKEHNETLTEEEEDGFAE